MNKATILKRFIWHCLKFVVVLLLKTWNIPKNTWNVQKIDLKYTFKKTYSKKYSKKENILKTQDMGLIKKIQF